MSEGPRARSPGMQVETHQVDGTLVLQIAGDWRLQSPILRFEKVLEKKPPKQAFNTVRFDASRVGFWDSSLPSFLLDTAEYCAEHGIQFDEASLPDNLRRLLILSRAVTERPASKRSEPASFVGRFGARGIEAFHEVVSSIGFTGEVVRSLFGFLTLRVRIRWRDLWLVIQGSSSGALPIVTLISFLVGMIIAFLGAVTLSEFGAQYYVSYLVSYGMLRELGALMTGIIMAGRTGAAFAAEIGSMKITEEIDAYRTLGISPVDFLVLPRVLGVFLTMPLLTLYADYIGILGGMIVAVSMFGMSVPLFFNGLMEPVTWIDAALGIFKGAVFGLTIGLSGCMRGMQTGSGAGAVGKSATSAVVTGITLIIVANALIDWAAAILDV